MMDPADIPHRVHPEKNPCRVDGESHQHSPMDAAVSKVLDDDNLLIKILLGVGFPTTLVRAALVCKRWYHHASDRDFLSHFRKLHPPRLLGYYISERPVSSEKLGGPRFVPMLPQPPEFAMVIRRLAGNRFSAHDDRVHITHCQNGIVFTRRYNGTGLTHDVHRPLCPDRGMAIIPAPTCVQDINLYRFSAILYKEGGDGSLSYYYVLGSQESGEYMVCVYVLQNGVWCKHTSATCQLQLRPVYLKPKAVLVNNKIYMSASDGGDIIVLDLTVSSCSTIQLPQGVTYNYFKSMLSPADDASSVYLIHASEFQLRIWLHKEDNWLLVHTFCLRMLDHESEDEHSAHVQISQVEDNAEFVFLRTDRCTLYLDVTSKTLNKVHETAGTDRPSSVNINPFMMICLKMFWNHLCTRLILQGIYDLQKDKTCIMAESACHFHIYHCTPCLEILSKN